MPRFEMFEPECKICNITYSLDPGQFEILWCHFIKSLTPKVHALSQFQAQDLMLRVASLVRQLASGQRAQLITRSVHYAAVMRKLSSPNRELRLQQFTTSPRNTTANANIEPNSDLGDMKELSVTSSCALYEGEGFDGAMHGVGREILSDGTVHEGGHTHGTRSGEGKLTYTDGKFHSGVFRLDRLYDGEGTIRLDTAGVEVFEGTVRDGKWNGPGKMSYPDGTFRDGMWKDSMLVQGKRMYLDGRIADGEWDKGQLLRGKITLKSGKTTEGTFQSGKLHGPGKVITAKGGVQEGNWVEGKLISSTSSTSGNMAESPLVSSTQLPNQAAKLKKASKKSAATGIAPVLPETTSSSAEVVSLSGVTSTSPIPAPAPLSVKSLETPASSLFVKQSRNPQGKCSQFVFSSYMHSVAYL